MVGKGRLGCARSIGSKKVESQEESEWETVLGPDTAVGEKSGRVPLAKPLTLSV